MLYGKVIVTELQEKISTQCLQFFGGNGYTEDYPMARMYRDARIGTIGAGTSEIMRDIIAKIIIDDIKYEKAKSNLNTKNNHSLNKNSLLDSLENKKDLVSVQSFLIAEDTLNITIKHINSSDKQNLINVNHKQ